MAGRIPYHLTQDVCVAIDSVEVAQYMTDTEYEQMQDILLDDVNIVLTFNYVKADRDVGIMHDYMTFTGKWGWCGEKGCDVLGKAINKLLSDIDVDERWGEVAYEQFLDYAEYLRV